MLIKLLPQAKKDLISGVKFYEEKQPGLGEYFLNVLYADIASLSFLAGIHTIHFGFYRLLSSKFPYAIYYDIIKDRAVITAILDTRRSPGWITQRLNQN